MSDDLFVKICGITSEADALLSVSLGAARSASCSPRRPARCRCSWRGTSPSVCPKILTVGVFRDEAPQRVVEIVHQAGLGAAQMHGHETAEETQWVRARVRMVIKAFPAGDPTIGRFEEFGADYLLVDGRTQDQARCSTGGWPRACRTDPPDRLGWPAPRQRGPGRGAPASRRRRRVDRGGVCAGAQGPAASPRVHRQRTGGRCRFATRDPLDDRRHGRGALRLAGRVSDLSPAHGPSRAPTAGSASSADASSPSR